MHESKSERRARGRVPAEVPIAINSRDGKVQTTGTSRDLSENGIFFYSETRLAPGSELEMVLVLPPEMTQGERRWVCCQASVVRVETGIEKGMEKGSFGLAASIRSMQVLPELNG